MWVAIVRKLQEKTSKVLFKLLQKLVGFKG